MYCNLLSQRPVSLPMKKEHLCAAPPIPVTTASGDEDDETDDLYGVAVRRCAVKQPKIYVVRGHKFIEMFFKSPTFCSYCSEFLWSVALPAAIRYGFLGFRLPWFFSVPLCGIVGLLRHGSAEASPRLFWPIAQPRWICGSVSDDE